MNDNSTWQGAHVDDIERRDRDIPVREHLGIHAFGINAYTPGEDGILISEHGGRRGCDRPRVWEPRPAVAFVK